MDAIVLDVMLPGMSGFEIAKKLRGRVETETIPILFLTAKTEESDQLEGLEAGGDTYLKKPVSPQVVLANIRAVLRRTGTEESKTLSVAGLTIYEDEYRATLDGDDLGTDADRVRAAPLPRPPPPQGVHAPAVAGDDLEGRHDGDRADRRRAHQEPAREAGRVRQATSRPSAASATGSSKKRPPRRPRGQEGRGRSEVGFWPPASPVSYPAHPRTMRWKRRPTSSSYPRRASTQTWMMLTFAMFVGLAVVGVGLYSIFVLQDQVRDAARETLRQQAERFAVQLEREPDQATMLELGRQIATVTQLDVALATQDTVLGNWGAGGVAGAPFFENEEVAEAIDTPGDVGWSVREGPDGSERFYLALYREPTGLILRLGEPTPPLVRAIEQVQAVLVIGMALALVLALLGAWLAARQVTRPLQAITRSAQRINEGDLDGRIQVRTRAAEFQDLTRSLNQMAGRFRADIHDLQRMQRVQNEFIGNVSHEVKNPIFAVFGYLEALASDSLSDGPAQALRTEGPRQHAAAQQPVLRSHRDRQAGVPRGPDSRPEPRSTSRI